MSPSSAETAERHGIVRYPKYKDSGVEWLGEVPEHWVLKPLKYLARLLTDKADTSLNQIGLENVEGWTGRFVPSESDFAGAGVAFQVHDILFGKLRPYLAKVYLAESPGEAVGDFHVLRPSVTSVPRFLQYQMLEPAFINIVDGSTFGSKMPRAGWDFVGGMPMPTPPADEQAAIAAFLDRETAKIDGLVEEQRRLIELLKEKRQAVISHAVTKGLNPDAPMKDSGVEWLGEVPEHWEVVPISLLAERLTYGFTNPMPTEDDGPYMLTANDIDYETVRYETARRTSINAFLDDLTDKSRPERDDLLITKDGTLGRIAIHDGRQACVNQSVAVFRVRQERLFPEFAMYCLLSGIYQEQMLFEAGGTTIKHIYISRFAKMQMVLPPLSEQNAIVAAIRNQIEVIDELGVDAQKAVSLLLERRTALISAAVTGKIDVRGAVDLEEEVNV